eukprot:gene13621-biopygen9105
MRVRTSEAPSDAWRTPPASAPFALQSADTAFLPGGMGSQAPAPVRLGQGCCVGRTPGLLLGPHPKRQPRLGKGVAGCSASAPHLPEAALPNIGNSVDDPRVLISFDRFHCFRLRSSTLIGNNCVDPTRGDRTKRPHMVKGGGKVMRGDGKVVKR